MIVPPQRTPENGETPLHHCGRSRPRPNPGRSNADPAATTIKPVAFSPSGNRELRAAHMGNWSAHSCGAVLGTVRTYPETAKATCAMVCEQGTSSRPALRLRSRLSRAD
jgi:hypothetical protein